MRLRSASKPKVDSIKPSEEEENKNMDNLNGSFEPEQPHPNLTTSHTPQSDKRRRAISSILKSPALFETTGEGDHRQTNGSSNEDTVGVERPAKKARVRFVDDLRQDQVDENCNVFQTQHSTIEEVLEEKDRQAIDKFYLQNEPGNDRIPGELIVLLKDIDQKVLDKVPAKPTESDANSCEIIKEIRQTDKCEIITIEDESLPDDQPAQMITVGCANKDIAAQPTSITQEDLQSNLGWITQETSVEQTEKAENHPKDVDSVREACSNVQTTEDDKTGNMNEEWEIIEEIDQDVPMEQDEKVFVEKEKDAGDMKDDNKKKTILMDVDPSSKSNDCIENAAEEASEGFELARTEKAENFDSITTGNSKSFEPETSENSDIFKPTTTEHPEKSATSEGVKIPELLITKEQEIVDSTSNDKSNISESVTTETQKVSDEIKESSKLFITEKSSKISKPITTKEPEVTEPIMAEKPDVVEPITAIERESDSEEEIETISKTSPVSQDPFSLHFELELVENDLKEFKKVPKKTEQVKLKKIGNCKYVYRPLDIPVKFSVPTEQSNPSEFIKSRLLKNLRDLNSDPRKAQQMSPLSTTLLTTMNSYKDLLFNERTNENADQIRLAYAVHALNHVLKTRSKVIRHNHKLNKKSSGTGEYRDQGFTRPKVLIVLPFRSSVFKLVDLLVKLFVGSKGSQNRESVQKPKDTKSKKKSKLKEEERPSTSSLAALKEQTNKEEEEEDEEDEQFEIEDDDREEQSNPKKEDDGINKGKLVIMNYKKFKKSFYNEDQQPFKKPEDFRQIFDGNTDEYFRMGIEITKSSCKLYSKFYSSDIIVASPLGLRTIIGADGEKQRDYDFLSSIELLIMDQSECFLMQNWEHVIHLMQHLNLQPKEPHGTDFSRIRMWSLDGLGRHYRQTLLFSSIHSLYLSSMFERECHNFEGKLVQCNPVCSQSVAIARVYLPIHHKFYRFESPTLSQSPDARFRFFVDKILPKFNTSAIGHTLIYIPSYFDYLRLRNHMRKHEISFTQICEHTEKDKMALSRKRFFMNKRTFLLYTERAHYYNRYQIKGIQHLIFYQPPTFPHLYSELCNLLHESNQRKEFVDDGAIFDCSVIYDKFDVPQLNQLIGNERTQQTLRSFLSVSTIKTGS